MRARLAYALTLLADRLLAAAARLDPMPELADVALPEPEPEPDIVHLSREVVIGLVMREAGPGGWLVIHERTCAPGPGCTCTPHAIRAQVGVA